LQIGSHVAETVKKYFGVLDSLIDVKNILNKNPLEADQDYKKII